MATPATVIDDLLAPISAELPAGEDITLAAEWTAINEARRPDPIVGRENADWPLIQRLLTDALARKSKNLVLGVWLMEASIKLSGFAGLRDSAHVLRRLILEYWDLGLYPEAEGGDLQFRAKPLEWLGEDNLPRAIRQIPLTARSDGGRDYSYFDFRQSREIGWEKDLRNALGDIDPEKEAKRRRALERGGVSAEAFEEAVKSTRRAGVEAIRASLDEAWGEFQQLDRVIDERFGTEAPSTSEAKEALEDCRRLTDDLLKRKRQEEPDQVAAPQEAADGSAQTAKFFSPEPLAAESFDGGWWAKAEELVRAGRIPEGLAEMTRLAAQQYGRARFQQRLRLAEICLGIDRRRLAIAILEELAKNIDELKLENWESPELLGRVWGRLCRCYKAAEPGSAEAARAATLFDRLCRLDPWQAFRWDQ
jgi:type VI secretion system protein ImpA